jgi:TetR/AcrR family transcriptional regulator, fatty acid metabolism regulator protein
MIASDCVDNFPLIQACLLSPDAGTVAWPAELFKEIGSHCDDRHGGDADRPVYTLTVRSEGDGRQRTFLEEARRAQIVQSAIEVIAERGYVNASLSLIAQHAGISKSIILYHFATKDNLIEDVISEVIRVATDFVQPKVRAETTAAGMLAAYIRARVGFLAAYPAYMRALLDIWISHRAPDGTMRLDHRAQEPALVVIEELLRRGQRDGEFREFAVRPMAVTISQAIDGVLLQLVAHPDLDIPGFAHELVTLFELATRKTQDP